MFEVNTSVTRESCWVQARAARAHHVKEICVVLAGLALATGILYAVRSPRVEFAATALGLAALYALLAVPLTALRLYSSRNTAVDNILLVFYADELRVNTNVEDTWLEYDQIRRMDESSKYFIVYAKHHAPLTFRKDEVMGGADGLKAFLEEKTGKRFGRIRR